MEIIVYDIFFVQEQCSSGVFEVRIYDLEEAFHEGDKKSCDELCKLLNYASLIGYRAAVDEMEENIGKLLREVHVTPDPGV